MASYSSVPYAHRGTSIKDMNSATDSSSSDARRSRIFAESRVRRQRKKKQHQSSVRWVGWLVTMVLLALMVSLWVVVTLFQRLNDLHFTPVGSSSTTREGGRLDLAFVHRALFVEAPVQHNDKSDDTPHAPFPPKFPMTTTLGAPQPQLSQQAIDMCTKALWHTLETTTIVLPDNETFIHTGDIDDLWLRDSAAQIHPLLVPLLLHKPTGSRTSLLHNDMKLHRIVSGLIKRTAMYIRHDPYANAFRIDDTYVFNEKQKRLGRHDLISTWNYELDSGCYFMRLLYYYWRSDSDNEEQTNDYYSVLSLSSVQQAVEIMVDLWTAEQRHELDDYPTGPLLDCLNCGKPHRYPTLPRHGKGSRTNASSGLTWTGFRPSDDECQYGFLVPSNMFAVVALEYMVDMARNLWKNEELAVKAQRLADEIQRGLEEHAIVQHPKFGSIYAYEVDGLGNSLLMDDANVPSLMSIPYLGYKYDPEIYANTRRFILSESNPTYRKGNNTWTGPIEGYGSPHMKGRIPNNIWPMSLAMQGLTSESVDEKVRLVEQLAQASAGTYWMHESFDVNNPRRFTRAWFCWSDSLFAELVMSLTDACPRPSHKYHVMRWSESVPAVAGGPYADDYRQDDVNSSVVSAVSRV